MSPRSATPIILPGATFGLAAAPDLALGGLVLRAAAAGFLAVLPMGALRLAGFLVIAAFSVPPEIPIDPRRLQRELADRLDANAGRIPRDIGERHVLDVDDRHAVGA